MSSSFDTKYDLVYGCCMEQMAGMRDRSVHLTLADIPYGETTRPSNGLRNHNPGKADQVTFDLQSFVREAVRVTRGHIIMFCGSEQLSPIIATFRDLDLVCIRHGAGRKTAPSPVNGRRGYVSGLELIAIAKRRRSPFYSSHQTALFDMPPVRRKNHPTPKHVATLTKIITDTTRESDIVFDPCMGSGSTGIAALQSGRRFLGVELDRKYFAAAAKSIRAVTE